VKQEPDMSNIEARSETTLKSASPRPVDMKLEVVVIPVSDVDHVKHFYAGIVREQTGKELRS
jgi:hypothetical protein